MNLNFENGLESNLYHNVVVVSKSGESGNLKIFFIHLIVLVQKVRKVVSALRLSTCIASWHPLLYPEILRGKSP